MPHEISVRENSEQLSIFARDDCCSGTNIRHRFEHIAYRRIGRNDGHGFTRAHDLMHTHEEATSDQSGGMKLGEIFLVKSARLEQHHCERVTQRQHHGRAGSGREIKRTRLLLDINIEKHMRVLRQG